MKPRHAPSPPPLRVLPGPAAEPCACAACRAELLILDLLTADELPAPPLVFNVVVQARRLLREASEAGAR